MSTVYFFDLMPSVPHWANFSICDNCYKCVRPVGYPICEMRRGCPYYRPSRYPTPEPSMTPTVEPTSKPTDGRADEGA